MVRQFLRNRQVMFFNHPRDKRAAEVMGHDLHPHLFTALAGDVVDRMLGNALAGDVAATANAVEQEAVVLLAFLEVFAAKIQPGL